jgi:glycosidase
MKKVNGFIFSVIIFLCSISAPAQIRHVEPLNWWIGMKNPNVQIMIYGNEIGLTTPSINYPGVTIKKVNKADNKNYLFIDLSISPATKPGNLPIQFIRDGKKMESIDYPLLARQKDAAKLKGFNSSDVIYLITPDRFANGDYNNDNIPGMKERMDRNKNNGRHGGDIRGIINNLDYISGMGFTAIWPTPLLENDMPVASYHGYAITNHYKTDPRFGTLEDYKELSSKMRDRGMKLIYDGVVNHTGSGYWWMKDLPFKDWINFADTPVITNHKRTVNEDRYASAYDKNLMTNGWFDTSMPDMNGRNPFMSNYLIQNSIWWIETLQLGGIRQDTYCYSDKIFLTNWSCSIMNEYPDFNIVGEEWSLNPLITSYWQTGKQRTDGYKSCLKTAMDFPMQKALVLALTEPEKQYSSAGLNRLYESLANDFAYADPKNILVFGDNHDMDRLYTQLNRDPDLAKMAITYLLTTRGIPEVYYGTEILMDNSASLDNHGVIRSDFPGGWRDDSVNAVTGMGLAPSQLKMQQYMRQLLLWRKANDVIANGETLHFAPFNGFYVYFRYNKEKTIMVIMNKNGQPENIDNRRFAEILKGKTKARNVLTSQELPLTSSFRIPAKTALILEIN